MKAGFYTTDITPPLGIEVPGGFSKVYNQGIHDPLKARAAVFEADGTTLAFVGVDTCELPVSAPLCTLVRQAVEERCGIPGENILLAASHTHSGGPLFGYLAEEFATAPAFVRDLFTHHSPMIDPAYFTWVVQQIVTAICEAYRHRETATLSVGSGVEDQVLFNRRFKMNNGRVYTHPGKGNPAIVEPAGPVDSAVNVLAAWDSRGTLLGCIVNYSCHATTWSQNIISADYVYYLEQTIQGALGSQAAVVFLLGACGDVTQVNNLSMREREFGETWSRRVGACVGAEAIKVMTLAEKGELIPLAARSIKLPLQRRAPSAARVAACRQIVEETLQGKREKDAIWLFAKEVLLLDWLITQQPTLQTEIQALQVGPAIFLANPAEYFAESGLAIKQASSFPVTFVVTLANTSVGYVPPAHAFAPSGGGYETVLNATTNLEIAAADKIAAATTELARQFQPSVLPQPPQLAQPQEAWSYGILGPDIE